MADIQVIALDDTQYQVTVIDRSTTSHHVTVKQAYAQQLTKGKISTVDLVKQSFAFLLQREPNTSILRNFDLSVIAHYFPDYEQIIQQH
jgi:UDP-glucose 4-epimerase